MSRGALPRAIMSYGAPEAGSSGISGSSSLRLQVMLSAGRTTWRAEGRGAVPAGRGRGTRQGNRSGECREEKAWGADRAGPWSFCASCFQMIARRWSLTFQSRINMEVVGAFELAAAAICCCSLCSSDASLERETAFNVAPLSSTV